jgi:hypothetical protein
MVEGLCTLIGNRNPLWPSLQVAGSVPLKLLLRSALVAWARSIARGILGISKDVPVGFESIHLHYEIAAPEASPEQLRALREKTEQYCVVMQTLLHPPKIETEWSGQE